MLNCHMVMHFRVMSLPRRWQAGHGMRGMRQEDKIPEYPVSLVNPVKYRIMNLH